MDAEHQAYVALARLHADYVALREECGKPYVQNTGESMAAVALARPRQVPELVEALRSLLDMLSNCYTDEEILENNKRRQNARDTVKKVRET